MRLSARRTSPPTTCVAGARFLKAAGLAGAAACSRLEPIPASPSASRELTASIDTTTLRAASAFLAHDDLRGRATGEPGGRIAAGYLAAERRRLGLEPLGDSYFQELPITQATIVPEGTSVRITGPGVDTTFAYYDDFIPDVGTEATLRDFAGDLVYVGRAQEQHGLLGSAVVRRLDDGARGPLTALLGYRRVESSLTGPGGMR